jgi:hypothetical protein
MASLFEIAENLEVLADELAQGGTQESLIADLRESIKVIREKENTARLIVGESLNLEYGPMGSGLHRRDAGIFSVPAYVREMEMSPAIIRRASSRGSMIAMPQELPQLNVQFQFLMPLTYTP